MLMRAGWSWADYEATPPLVRRLFLDLLGMAQAEQANTMARMERQRAR